MVRGVLFANRVDAARVRELLAKVRDVKLVIDEYAKEMELAVPPAIYRGREALIVLRQMVGKASASR